MENRLSWQQPGQSQRPSTLRRAGSFIGGVIPILIIAALMYGAFFVKPSVHTVGMSRPAIEQRDLFYSVVMPADDTVLAVGNFGKIIVSKDGGASWSPQSSGVAVSLQSVAAWDSNRVVAVGNNLTAIYTSDGGENWVDAEVDTTSESINKLVRVRVLAGGHAIAVGEFGVILASDDFGASWRAISAGEDVSWNDVAPLDISTSLIVGEFGRIEITSDGGEAWTQIPSPVKSSLNSVFFRDRHNGIAVGTEGVVLSTTDGGATWTRLPVPTQQHIFDVMWDGRKWVLTGDKGLLLFGSADAKNWTDMSQLTDSGWHTQTSARNGVYALAGRGGVGIIDGSRTARKTERSDD